MSKKFILENFERDRIKNLYGIKPQRDYVFEAYISFNGRYLVLQDQVYDIVENKDLGGIFESFDILKTILTNCESDDKEYSSLRESLMNLPIVESEVSPLELKKMLMEDFFTDTWLGKQLSNTGKGITDTYQQAKEGLAKFGTEISKGDWNNIVSMFGKGVLFVLRKLKEAMFSNVGMILDSILVVSGIGKTVQWIPWALIVSLDLYEMISGNYDSEDEKNAPIWSKALDFGIDVIGLIATASAAKAARLSVKPIVDAAIHDPQGAVKMVEKAPGLKSLITKMINGLKSVPKYLEQASTYLSKSFPKGSQFIKSIFTGMSTFLEECEKGLSQLIGEGASKMVMTGTKSGGLLYGIDKGSSLLTRYKTGMNDVQLQNMNTLSGVINKKYGGKNPFD